MRFDLKAYDWHHRPKEAQKKRVCPICGCRVRCGEHRRVPQEEKEKDYVWEKRRKTATGWEFFPIGSKSEEQIRKVKEDTRDLKKDKAKHILRCNSLVKHFYGTFLPKHLPKWSPYTLQHYRRAMAKFTRFIGRDDFSLSAFDDGVVDRFREWLVDNGADSELARVMCSYIRQIVREARPEKFPKRSDIATVKAVGWIGGKQYDTEGSLYAFALHVYQIEKMVGKTDSSKYHQLISLRHFCQLMGKTIMLSELCDELISEYMQKMLDQGYARPTINTRRADILAAWRFAYKKKLIDRYPMVDKIKVYRSLPTAWTKEEMTRILAVCGSLPGIVGEHWAKFWWPAFLLTLYNTSARLQAALQTERDKYDPASGWLSIPAEIQKQKVEQKYELSPQTRDAIALIWGPPRRFLFPWPSNPRQIWPHYEKILQAAGLATTRRDKFQKIRRTTATHICAVAGMDAACRQLGHSSVDMTRRYVDPRIARAHLDGANYLPKLEIPTITGDI